MDVKKIQYIQNLIKNKIRIERELEALNIIIDEIKEECDHLEVKVTDGPCNSTRCLFCGKKLGNTNDSLLTINACTYKEEEYHKGFSEAEKLARLNDLRSFTIECLLINPDITREELIEELNRELNKEEKSKKKRK